MGLCPNLLLAVLWETGLAAANRYIRILDTAMERGYDGAR